MKKKLAVVVICIMAVFMLAACGKKFTCDICGEEKSGTCHETEILGQELQICDDCYESIDSITDTITDGVEDVTEAISEGLEGLFGG